MSRKLIGVIGPTATGKSEVAVAIAQTVAGEIVGADAYQVYRGLDVGTAKPAPELQRRVPHHLVDVLDPSDELTLARYLDMATEAIHDVWDRDRIPVLCGGSGQYVWAVIEGWQVPRVPPYPGLRQELESFAASEGADALHERLRAADPVAAQQLDPRNVRRVVRALEVIEREGRPLSACRTRLPIDAEVLLIGLRCGREELHRRIDARVDAMFGRSFVAEVESLRAAGFGEARPVRSGIGYKEVSTYLDGECSLGEAIGRTKTATHRLARSQSAWFKNSDSRITWIEAGAQATASACSLVRRWMASGD